MAGFMGLTSDQWLGQGGGEGGLLAPAMGLASGWMNYNQAKGARKDKMQMFDKQFAYNKGQDAIARADYLKKQKNEEDAWANFGKSGDPYAKTVHSNTIV